MDIDLIMPWVDGNDPAWLADKEKYVNRFDGEKGVNRFRDWDNLQYWFRGVEKNLPWIRKIHFITWGHLPSWLNKENPKLNIVRHEDYIPEQYLPTFNSHVIELNIHRIPDLAEHFIYANDDTFFVEPVNEADFFRDGLPCACPLERVHVFKKGGIDHIVANNLEILNDHFNKADTLKKHWNKWFSLKYKRYILKNIYMLPVKQFPGFVNPHLPNPFLKHTFEEVWEAEESVLDKTSSHKFRSNEDVNQWLMRYWQFAKGEFVPGNVQLGKFYSIGKDDANIAKALEQRTYKILCLSDDSETLDFETEKRYIKDLLDGFLPDKSSFEL